MLYPRHCLSLPALSLSPPHSKPGPCTPPPPRPWAAGLPCRRSASKRGVWSACWLPRRRLKLWARARTDSRAARTERDSRSGCSGLCNQHQRRGEQQHQAGSSGRREAGAGRAQTGMPPQECCRSVPPRVPTNSLAWPSHAARTLSVSHFHVFASRARPTTVLVLALPRSQLVQQRPRQCPRETAVSLLPWPSQCLPLPT